MRKFALFCRPFWEEKTHKNTQKCTNTRHFAQTHATTPVYYTPVSVHQKIGISYDRELPHVIFEEWSPMLTTNMTKRRDDLSESLPEMASANHWNRCCTQQLINLNTPTDAKWSLTKSYYEYFVCRSTRVSRTRPCIRCPALAHQNRTIAIPSDFRVDWAKSPEIPQKEGVLGSEIAARNRKSLATFHRTLKSQCGIALSCFGDRAISGVRSAMGITIANRKNRCDFGALSIPPMEPYCETKEGRNRSGPHGERGQHKWK